MQELLQEEERGGEERREEKRRGETETETSPAEEEASSTIKQQKKPEKERQTVLLALSLSQNCFETYHGYHACSFGSSPPPSSRAISRSVCCNEDCDSRETFDFE